MGTVSRIQDGEENANQISIQMQDRLVEVETRFNRASLCSLVFTQNKHYENSLVNPTYAGCELSFTPGLSSLLLVTSVCFPSFL